jgi:hypothetical protein
MTTIHRVVIAHLRILVARSVHALSGEHRPWAFVRPQPAKRSIPVKHEGATERFGSELRALRDVEVSPELVTDIETELRWGLIWYDFERAMQTEIDRVFAPYLPVPECRDFDDLRDLVGLRELAAV